MNEDFKPGGFVKIVPQAIIKFDGFEKFLIVSNKIVENLLAKGWIDKTDIEGEYVATKDFQLFYDGAMGL